MDDAGDISSEESAEPRHGIGVDLASFPIVRFTFRGTPPADEFRAFLKTCSELLRRERPFVVVVDARDGGVLSYASIMDAAAWLEREDWRRRALCHGTALVLPGPVQRAVLNAVLRVTVFEDHEVFADVDHAVAWAERLLRA